MHIVNKVVYYQSKIRKCKKNSEELIDCITKLHKLPITVRHLEKTGIGKTINALRKIYGDVRNAAKALVWKWKQMTILETAAEEQARNESSLKNQDVSSSGENFLIYDRVEEAEKESTNTEVDKNVTLSSTAAEELCEEYINSTANQNCKVSKYEIGQCDTCEPSTEGEASFHLTAENTSKIHAFNLHYTKDNPSHYHHHNQHTRGRRDKQEKKNVKHHHKAEAGMSELRTIDHKINLNKVISKDIDQQEERKSEIPGVCSKRKNHIKLTETQNKASESKHHNEVQVVNQEGAPRKQCIENKRSKSSEKAKKMKIANIDDNIDRFAAALRMGDAMTKKNKNRCTIRRMINSPSRSYTNFKRADNPTPETDFAKPVKLKPCNVEVDLTSTTPEISHVHSPQEPLKDEAVALIHTAVEVTLSKWQRTKVYSGVKVGRPVPTLNDLCIHVLKKNIDALEYTGGVPYDILRPILQQATPEQLFQVEIYNPYLLENTDELWNFHCRRNFGTCQRQSMVTAREMYLRCLDERDAKLKAVTSNIQHSLTKSTPVCQIKLAYMDSNAKPPNNVARQQAKYGTGSIPKYEIGKLKKSGFVSIPLTSTASALNHSTSIARSSFPQSSIHVNAKTKPQMAPLMQKTLKLAKSFKR